VFCNRFIAISVLCFVALLVPAEPVTAQDLACTSSSTLESLVNCIYSHIPGAGGGFVIPSEAAQADWRAAVTEMMHGNCSTTLPINLAGIMERRSFVDSSDGRTYCVMMEVLDADNNNIIDRGWGTFITYDNAMRESNVMAPHPIHEIGTHTEAVSMFRDMDARSFAMAGAHRNANADISPCNSAYPTSDPTHTKENMMFETAAALLAHYGEADWHMIQIHGKDNASCNGADVVMADGVVGTPTPEVHSLYQQMTATHPTWNIVEPATGYTCLQATETIMGRLLNDVAEANVCSTAASSPSGRFLYLEQNSTSRNPDDWVSALREAFPAVPPAAPGTLAATAGNARVRLSWSAATGAASYTVLRSTASNGPYTTVQTGINTAEYSDVDLSNGTTYYYVVSAVNAYGESPYSNEAAATPMVYTLTVTFAGTGGGTVAALPTPPVTGCNGSCTQPVGTGTVVTLTAVPDSYSAFSGWSGCDAVSNNQCTVTMSRAKNPEVYFNKTVVSPIKIGGSYFGTIAAAYETVSSGGEISLTGIDFHEVLVLNRNVAFRLRGGYSGDFLSFSGYSIIHGSLSIGQGSVEVSNLVIH
jgi:hypothetical protein